MRHLVTEFHLVSSFNPQNDPNFSKLFGPFKANFMENCSIQLNSRSMLWCSLGFPRSLSESLVYLSEIQSDPVGMIRFLSQTQNWQIHQYSRLIRLNGPGNWFFAFLSSKAQRNARVYKITILKGCHIRRLWLASILKVQSGSLKDRWRSFRLAQRIRSEETCLLLETEFIWITWKFQFEKKIFERPRQKHRI